jgi:unsaturated chondroitin disaccharide hydrolase
MNCLPAAPIYSVPTIAFAFAISVLPLHSTGLEDVIANTWTVAIQRTESTVGTLNAAYGNPLMHARYPRFGSLSIPGSWDVTGSSGDWRAGFWPGTLWLLSQHTGDNLWRGRAENWSAALVTTSNNDHDIGFIMLGALGKGWQFHDDLTDPGGTYRATAKAAITSAATKLNLRFNQPNTSGVPIPAGFIRSWNHPYISPYPVCIDNLMNLELLFLAYEINGRLPSQRVWFDHALAHARNSITHLLRPNGGTYHVVNHFESGPKIGQIERKRTVQGYGGETTWSRGQAWAIYGFTAAYRHARRDPGTNAADLLAAAQLAANYFIDRLPHHFTADTHNHRIGDYVPPTDFDAALGEPIGPWNDANLNYNSSTGTGLGDRMPPTTQHFYRDSSAAAIAASGLIELSQYATMPADRERYLATAKNILHCLITFDGNDIDTLPDYFCGTSETAHPGILKLGRTNWSSAHQSQIYADYYFLEALARYETLQARKTLTRSQRIAHDGNTATVDFETTDPVPTLAIRVQKTTDLESGVWTTVAAKTGMGAWSGAATVTEAAQPNNCKRFSVSDPTPGPKGFFRILTHSVGGGGP